MDKYAQRRHQLLTSIAPDALVILTSAPMVHRSHDTHYRYRPNSDLYYLTGWDQPETLCVLTTTHCILFTLADDPAQRLWNGARESFESIRSRLGLDMIYPLATYPQEIQRLMKGIRTLYRDFDAEDSHQSLYRSIHTHHHLPPLIRRLRLIKDESEIDILRRAIAITAEAHHHAMREACAGMAEYALESTLIHTCHRLGAREQAYTPIVAGGSHANTLHYIDNNDTLRDGDLVLIDAGCELEYYASDITRTFPINGIFTPAQRTLYMSVLTIQHKVLAILRPGLRYRELQEYAQRLCCEALIDLELLSGEVDTLLANQAHKRYAPHGIGHWLGLDVHDPCPYVDEQGESLPLLAGMVLTIEPGIYCDHEAPIEAYRGIGIRIEDTILITEEGYENLSQEIVKEIEEIEAMCSSSLSF